MFESLTLAWILYLPLMNERHKRRGNLHNYLPTELRFFLINYRLPKHPFLSIEFPNYNFNVIVIAICTHLLIYYFNVYYCKILFHGLVIIFGWKNDNYYVMNICVKYIMYSCCITIFISYIFNSSCVNVFFFCASLVRSSTLAVVNHFQFH